MKTHWKTAIAIGLATGAGAAVLSMPAAAPTPTELASAAAPTDSVRNSRATVRDAPTRLVIATALPGDRIALTAYCGGWVRVRITARHAMSTPVGWIERGSLTRAARAGGLAGVPHRCDLARKDQSRWRSYVSAMNAPFRSYYRNDAANPRRPWRRVFFATGARLVAAPDCVPSYNYVRGKPDRVDPAQRISGLDLSRIGYRYVTKSGAVALVSTTMPGRRAGVWAFVPAGCVQGRDGGVPYFAQVVQFDRLPKAANGNVPRTLPTSDLRRFGCHAGVRSPVSPAFGWWPDPVPGHRPGCPF